MDLSLVERAKKRIQVRDPLCRELLAEFSATFLLVVSLSVLKRFIGTSVNAQHILTNKTLNTYIEVILGWGFAITFSVYAAMRTSGAHLNPAISMMFYSMGSLPLKKLLLYCVTQVAGAFLGGAATYIFYERLISSFDGGTRQVAGELATAGVFATYPAGHLGFLGPYLDQIVGTGLLGFFVCLLVDENNEIPSHLVPILLGFVVMMIGTCFGVNLGFPINPARDFGPRLFTYFIYGPAVFSHPYPLYWLAPIIGPLIGAPLAGWLYQVLFGAHLPDKRPLYRVVDTKDMKIIDN